MADLKKILQVDFSGDAPKALADLLEKYKEIQSATDALKTKQNELLVAQNNYKAQQSEIALTTSARIKKENELLTQLAGQIKDLSKKGKERSDAESANLAQLKKQYESLKTEKEKNKLADTEATLNLKKQLDDTKNSYRSVTEQIKTQNAAKKELLNSNIAESGTYGEIEKNLKRIANLRKNFAVVGTDDYRRLEEQEAKLNTQLKELDVRVGNYFRNVGNYKESIIKALRESGQSGVAENLVISLKKELKTAEDDVKKFGLAYQNAINAKADTKELQKIESELLQAQSRAHELGRELDSVNDTTFGRVKAQLKETFSLSSVLQQGIGVALGTFTVDAIIQGVSRVVDYNIELSRVQTELAKTTDLTNQQVSALTNNLQALDTPTDLKSRIDIAKVGGQFGIANDELLAFVETIDKANVALGDELGTAEEVATKLQGVSNAYKLDEALGGTAVAINAVGSTLNELSKKGTATASNLQEVIGKTSGFGTALGKTAEEAFANAAGYAAVLENEAVKGEVAYGGLIKLFGLLPKNVENVSKVLGLTTKETKNFSDLVNTDLNAAILFFIEKLNLSGKSTTEQADLLKKLGIEGQTEAIVFQKLAKNIGEISVQQGIANTAIKEGTSLNAEFVAANDSLSSSFDKLKNDLINAFAGAGVQGGLKFLIDKTRELFAVVRGGFDSISQNETLKKAFDSIGTTLGSVFSILINLTSALFAGLNKIAPVVGLISISIEKTAQVLGYFAEAINSALQPTKQLATTQSLVKEATDLANKSIADEALALQKSVNLVNSKIATDRDKRAEYEKMQKIYPQYFGNLSYEDAINGKLKDGYDRLTKAIREKANAIAFQEVVKQATIEKAKKEIALNEELLKTEEALVAKGQDAQAKVLANQQATQGKTGFGKLIAGFQTSYGGETAQAKKEYEAYLKLTEEQRKGFLVQKSKSASLLTAEIADYDKRIEIGFKLSEQKANSVISEIKARLQNATLQGNKLAISAIQKELDDAIGQLGGVGTTTGSAGAKKVDSEGGYVAPTNQKQTDAKLEKQKENNTKLLQLQKEYQKEYENSLQNFNRSQLEKNETLLGQISEIEFEKTDKLLGIETEYQDNFLDLKERLREKEITQTQYEDLNAQALKTKQNKEGIVINEFNAQKLAIEKEHQQAIFDLKTTFNQNAIDLQSGIIANYAQESAKLLAGQDLIFLQYEQDLLLVNKKIDDLQSEIAKNPTDELLNQKLKNLLQERNGIIQDYNSQIAQSSAELFNADLQESIDSVDVYFNEINSKIKADANKKRVLVGDTDPNRSEKLKEIESNEGVAELANERARLEAKKVLNQQYLEFLKNETNINADDKAKIEKRLQGNIETINNEIVANDVALKNKRVSISDESAQKRKEIEDALWSGLGEFATGTLELEKQQQDAYWEQQYADLNAQKDAELSNANLTAEAKEQIELKYQEKQKVLKRKELEEKKEIAKKEAFIKAALAALEILKEHAGNPILSAVLLGTLAVTTAINIAKIESQKFGRGGGIKGASHLHGGVPAQVSGGQVVELEGGEAVQNKHSVAKMPLLTSFLNQSYGDGVPIGNTPKISDIQKSFLVQAELFLQKGSYDIIPKTNPSAFNNLMVLVQNNAQGEYNAVLNASLLVQKKELELQKKQYREQKEYNRQIIKAEIKKTKALAVNTRALEKANRGGF